jgi:hypothetical protein
MARQVDVVNLRIAYAEASPVPAGVSRAVTPKRCRGGSSRALQNREMLLRVLATACVCGVCHMNE